MGGRGLYALQPIKKGTRIIEYAGERRKWHDYEAGDDSYVFLFSVEDDETVIDPFRGGNEARFINHSCAPNCRAEEHSGRIYIKAIRDIAEGEELFYDYALVVAGKPSKADRERYACLCGAPNCRGTMIALPKKKAAKQAGKAASAQKTLSRKTASERAKPRGRPEGHTKAL